MKKNYIKNRQIYMNLQNKKAYIKIQIKIEIYIKKRCIQKNTYIKKKCIQKKDINKNKIYIKKQQWCRDIQKIKDKKYIQKSNKDKYKQQTYRQKNINSKKILMIKKLP